MWLRLESANCQRRYLRASSDRCETYDNGGYKLLTQDPASGKSYYFPMNKTGIAKPN